MTTLGKYEVLEELAKGSMGVIYRARDPILDREVALKTIAGAGNVDPEMKERFYREARAGAKLHHPNVITVYELGEQETLLFIALELLSGCDLRQFIRERRPLPWLRKVRVMAAVCDGLHHAHMNGVVHRDIKPSNVFLTDGGVPKILDFGVARLSASKLTVVGRVLGTPFYMAPEQIMGQPCDARSDMFALAMVTYEFLTYAHPFAGDMIPKRILNDPPDSLVAHDPELAGVEPILKQALAKDPAQRYRNVEEFGLALRSLLPQPSTMGAMRPRAAPARQAPAPAEPPEMPSTAVPPKNANTETKMSAILTALQGFDQAIEQKDIKMARAALAIIEELAKVDDRFGTAAKESRGRLSELEASMPPVPAAAERPAVPPRPAPQPAAPAPPPAQTPPQTPPPARRPSVYRAEPLLDTPAVQPPPPAPPPVREPPRAKATVPPVLETAKIEAPAAPPPPQPAPGPPGGSLDDATSIFRMPGEPGPRPKPATQPPAAPAPPHPPTIPLVPPPRASAARPPDAAPPRTLPPPVRPSQAPAPGTSDNRVKLLIGGGAAVFVIVALIAYFVMRPGNATVEPAEATAQVVAAQANVLSTPSDDADVVAKLKKGDTVNVMRPPRTASQEWTEVQFIGKTRVYPKGVMKTAYLGNWNSPKPDTSLFLIEMNAPPDGAGEAALRQYANSLKSFIQRFSATPQRDDAQAELDRTNAALARLGSAPPPTAQKQAQQPAQQKPIKTPGTSPGSPPQQPVLNIEAELARANNQWENGQYAQAERILKRILQQKPGDERALDMLRRVQKAKQLEGR